jgi:hypothetical protein
MPRAFSGNRFPGTSSLNRSASHESLVLNELRATYLCTEMALDINGAVLPGSLTCILPLLLPFTVSGPVQDHRAIPRSSSTGAGAGHKTQARERSRSQG